MQSSYSIEKNLGTLALAKHLHIISGFSGQHNTNLCRADSVPPDPVQLGDDGEVGHRLHPSWNDVLQPKGFLDFIQGVPK